MASLFQFWCVLYLGLVFISIMFHVARDYRNWVLPFIALFAVSTVGLMVSLLFDIDFIGTLDKGRYVSTEISYFTNNYQNAALSIYATIAMFFVVSMIATVSSRPVLIQDTYKTIIASFFIAVVIYIISPNKSKDLLIFTIPALAIMATNHIELPQLRLKQEMVLGVLILCSLFAFFSQL